MPIASPKVPKPLFGGVLQRPKLIIDDNKTPEKTGLKPPLAGKVTPLPEIHRRDLLAS